MSTLPNVRDLLEGHVTLELDCIDRLYLNGYVARLQHGAGLVEFLCQHRGQPIASPALLGQITGKFIAAVKSFAAREGVPLFHWRSKDHRAGYDYRLSIWQMEMSLTQVLDRPASGRQFFEEVIRDNPVAAGKRC